MQFSKNFRSTVRILMIVLILPMITLISVLYQSYNRIDDYRKSYTDQVQAINEARWILVSSVIKENRDKSAIQAESVREKIESRLIREYHGDFFALRRDLDSNSDTLAFKIMNEEITNKYINVQNDNNDMFIATPKKIIVDKSINCSIGKQTRSWEEEISIHDNKELASEAIKLMVGKSNSLIFWKFLPDTIVIKSEDKLTFPSKSGLKNIYTKYGLEGLKSYEFLVPTYIKQDGDIFEVPDVSMHGFRNDNYKIIVVQGFSIADALEKDYGTDLAYFTYLECTAKRELDHKITQTMRELAMNLALLLTSFIGIGFAAAQILTKWGGDDAIGGCKS